MSDLLKSTLGFMGILFVGLLGVLIAEFFRVGDMNATISTVDNIIQIK
ncbi:MAG: hypothetical protein PHS95_03330 [Candidatus Pacebacteria bacterium]|nr:hypothetical protein [Candidatus Paceibacterota bacterium]